MSVEDDDLFSEAMREAIATARTDIVDYHVFEINCARFTQPARVAWGWEVVTAMIEDGAPSDAGTMQDFHPAPIEFSAPAVVADSESSLQMDLWNVSKDIIMALDANREDPLPVSLIYRVYMSNRLELGPERNPPMTMMLKNVQVDPRGGRITGRAAFSSLIGRNFPFPSYTIAEFPGLKRY